jgi:hypothetical protein
MPSISPDFSEAAGLKAGEYLARISDSELGEKAETGSKWIKWTLTTADNPEAAMNNFPLTYFTNYVGKGAGFFKRFVEAAVGETIADEIADFNTDDIHGRMVKVIVIDDPERGYPKVKSVRGAGV